MKKVCLYLRVSTASQTTENQKRELEQYCKRQDWKVVRTYDDSNYSGTRNDRPALNEMLTDALKGKFDLVCVYTVCRLGRSTLDLLTVLKQLQDAKVGFVSVSQGLDSTNSAGRMLASFLSILAQWERELIVDRVKAGLSRAKSQGVQLGRPRKGIDIKKALELKRQGLGVKAIAKQLNVPKSTCYYALEAVR